MNTINCKDYSKKSVCKFIGEYKAYIEKLKDIPKEEFFLVDIVCTEFHRELTLRKGL